MVLVPATDGVVDVVVGGMVVVEVVVREVVVVAIVVVVVRFVVMGVGVVVVTLAGGLIPTMSTKQTFIDTYIMFLILFSISLTRQRRQ